MSASLPEARGDSASGVSVKAGLRLSRQEFMPSHSGAESILPVLETSAAVDRGAVRAKKDSFGFLFFLWLVGFAGLLFGLAVSRVSHASKGQSLSFKRASLRTSPPVSLDDVEWKRQVDNQKRPAVLQARISSLRRAVAEMQEALRERSFRCSALALQVERKANRNRELSVRLKELRRRDKKERQDVFPFAEKLRYLAGQVNRARDALVFLRSNSPEDREGFLEERRAELQELWRWTHGEGQAPSFEEATVKLVYSLLVDLFQSGGVLRDQWRGLCAHELGLQLLRSRLASSELRRLVRDFLRRKKLEKEDVALFEEKTRNILQTYTADIEVGVGVQRNADSRVLALKASSLVKLAVSKSLNERQRGFDLRRAEEVASFSPVLVLRSAVESLGERESLRDVKEELRLALEIVKREETPADTVGEAALSVFDSLVESSPPFGPSRLTVENFRKIDAPPQRNGERVQFSVRRILGGSWDFVLAEVEAAEPELRDELGVLSMKMYLPVVRKSAASVASAAWRTVEKIRCERSALLQIAGLGERPEKVALNAGLVGASHIGRLESDFPSVVHVSTRRVCVPALDVTFAPVAHFAFPLKREPPLLSMKTRVFLAQRLLLAVGRLNLRGFCFNDLKTSSVALTQDLEPVLADLEAVSRVGEKRMHWSGSSLSPEAALHLAQKEQLRASFKAEAWSVGVLLFSILSGGELPFVSQRSAFLELSSANPAVVAKAAKRLQNAESPVFALRRLDVPDTWMSICSLLLQPDPEMRPTVLQVLRAFPQVRDVVSALREIEEFTHSDSETDSS